ncbi:MAG: DNA polymerase Y family protein, partial [Verrucomicrobiota bacterium]
MFAALTIPNFHLTAQLRNRPDLEGQPVVLLDDTALSAKTQKLRGKARVLQRNRAAAEHDVELGMTAVQAQARSASLHLLNHEAEDEAWAQSDLLDCAAAFTPDFEATADGAVTLDLLSVAQPPRKVGRSMVDWLAGAELPAQVGFAENPDLALLAAKFADPVTIVESAKEARRDFLDPLPLSAISPSPEAYEVLDSWGIDTLGKLTRLPRHEVTERLGPEAGTLWDHASGTRRRLLKLVRPPVEYAQSTELEFEITTLEPLLFLLRRWLETMVARLNAGYLVAERLLFSLRFDDGATHERSFRVPDPCADVELLFGILHTHLEDFVAKAPIVAASLDVIPTKPGKHQFHLFESSIRDPTRFADTLARLEALLGSENVGIPELLPTHRADSFRMTGFGDSATLSSPPASQSQPSNLPSVPFLGLP